MPLLETKGAASSQGFGQFARSGQAVFVEDVFSTFLYTGNGSTQTITNGIDLAGKGGMVWFKKRSGATDHRINDTNRGSGFPYPALITNSTAAAVSDADGVFTFNSNGFTAASGGSVNGSSDTYASWTFRKQPKFFDVVTYTGNGANRTIAHNLGSVPGCIIVKRTDTTADWQVYHRSIANTEYLVLNDTAAKATGTTRWNSTTPTSTVFSLGTDTTVNANTGTYVAYLFAHDAGGFGQSGTDNVVSCGSYTGNGNATGPTVTLNYEPQWLMIKNASNTGNWNIFDNMRGMTVGGDDWYLEANTSDAEASANWITPTASGFQITTTSSELNTNTETYIYIAIRRGPMKTPTTGTSVFQPVVYTGTNVDNRLVNTTIAPDMVWVRQRDDTVLGGMVVGDRLRGQPYLLTGTTDAEVNDADALDQQIVSATEYGTAFSAMNGFYCGNDATAKLNTNTTSNNHIAEAFKRAPGFFDVVCYTGNNGSYRNINHSLGVIPELIIVKARTSPSSPSNNWGVWTASLGNSDANNAYNLYLNTTDAKTGDQMFGLSSLQTATQFRTGGQGTASINLSSNTYVAYLFASLTGISKVGSYTGTGNVLQIDCGFTGGARFVLIKRTDSTGDWYVWDTARGIVAGNDPYLLLNSTAAEVTTTDWVDTYSAGFELSNAGGNNANINTATYIYLAIA